MVLAKGVTWWGQVTAGAGGKTQTDALDHPYWMEGEQIIKKDTNKPPVQAADADPSPVKLHQWAKSTHSAKLT